jgi:hypothetical protein
LTIVTEHVSQIFLSDQPVALLSPALELASDSVRAGFPAAHYRRYDEAAVQGFLRAHFDPDVRAAYDRLEPYAYKADLARYCILYVHGGWYFDLGVRLLTRPQLAPDTELLAFRDVQRNSGTSWACAIGFIHARPRHPVLRLAIERVVRNVATSYYGITPLCPTGPTVFGHALADAGADSRSVLGDLMPLTPFHPERNLAYVMPDGEIVAFGKRAPGGNLAALGASGVNNYNDLWRRRCVYR